MSGNRLLTATAILAVLLGLTVWQWNSREAEDAHPATVSVQLPKVSKDAIDELEITIPSKPKVVLKKQDKIWKLVEPVAAKADQNAADSAIAKLAEIEVIGVAATKADNYAKLEVDDAQAMHVVAKGGDKVMADLLLGGYRSGNTMVREKGATMVASVKGSIKYAFEKEIKDWRDRTVTDSDPDKVKEVTFQNANGTFHFVQASTEWKEAPLEKGQKPIPKFDGAQVKSIVSSVARISAADFAPASTAADTAGVGQTPEGLVTFLPSGDGAQPIVLRIGKKLDTNYYLARDGAEPIYLVSEYVGQRLLPKAESFAKEEPKPTPPPQDNAPMMPQGLPPGMRLPPGMQLPPGH